MDKLKLKLAAIGAPLMLTGASVMAAVPAEVKTALTDAKSDSIEVAGLCLVIAIGLAAFLWMRRAAK